MASRGGDRQPDLFTEATVVTVREMKVSSKITTEYIQCPVLVSDIVRKVVPRGVRWYDDTVGEWTIGNSRLAGLIQALTAAGCTIEHEVRDET